MARHGIGAVCGGGHDGRPASPRRRRAPASKPIDSGAGTARWTGAASSLAGIPRASSHGAGGRVRPAGRRRGRARGSGGRRDCWQSGDAAPGIGRARRRSAPVRRPCVADPAGCLGSLPTLQSDLVGGYTWACAAAPRRLRAGARAAAPGRRYHRRPGAIRVTAPRVRRDRSHAPEPCSATGTDKGTEHPAELNRRGALKRGNITLSL